MITFAFIEDYLEVLAGYRDISSHGHSPGLTVNFFSNNNSGPLNLARYDVNILANMAGTTILGKALTDRQAELAIKLVAKYQKQFASKGVDVTPSVQQPVFRQQTRIVDRTHSVFIRDNFIILKFPYDKSLVQMVSRTAKESKGSFKFDHELKEWRLSITEHNVNWVSGLTDCNFTISADVSNLMQLILDCEEKDYSIQLVELADTFSITNAEPSLTRYIDANVGGHGHDNLIKLVDVSAMLGYKVSDDICSTLNIKFDPIILGLLLNRVSHFMRHDLNSDGIELLTPLIEYAKLTNRWPIYIYDPTNHLCTTAKKLFDATEFYDVTNKKDTSKVDLTGIKCVYFNKVKQVSLFSIPILISTNAMLFGGEKQWLLTAQKIVYYTATTYNQETTSIASKINN